MTEEQPLYDLRPLDAAGYTRPEIARMAKAYRAEHGCSLGAAIAALTEQLTGNEQIMIENIQAQTIRQQVASSRRNSTTKRMDYVFPVASGVPYWRVVVGDDVSDHLELADAVAAYNAGWEQER